MSSHQKPSIDWQDNSHHAEAEDGLANIPNLVSLARRSSRVKRPVSGGASPETFSPEICPAAPAARNPKFWASFCDSLKDGFVLHGISVYPTEIIALDLAHIWHRQSSEEVLGHANGVRASTESPSISPRFEPEEDPKRDSPRPGWLRTISAVAATPWTSSWAWFRHEREIRQAVESLRRLDDNTLRDIGIPDRSQIEWRVRQRRDR
jgi:uncharacterized protein YjiS (DUF1127 family)